MLSVFQYISAYGSRRHIFPTPSSSSGGSRMSSGDVIGAYAGIDPAFQWTNSPSLAWSNHGGVTRVVRSTRPSGTA
jgi:hypothetical protein